MNFDRVGIVSFVNCLSGFVPPKFICILIKVNDDLYMYEYITRISTLFGFWPVPLSFAFYVLLGISLHLDASFSYSVIVKIGLRDTQIRMGHTKSGARYLTSHRLTRAGYLRWIVFRKEVGNRLRPAWQGQKRVYIIICQLWSTQCSAKISSSWSDEFMMLDSVHTKFKRKKIAMHDFFKVK